MPFFYHKIDSLRWLDGSIREDLAPDERSVWADLLALAGLTREPRRGYIERSEGIPYKKAVLLSRLEVTEDLFDRAVAKCVAEGRLQVLLDGTMRITNWMRYNDTAGYEEKKEVKKSALDRAKISRQRKDKLLQSLTAAINRQNITQAQTARALGAIERLLAGGRDLTMKELFDLFRVLPDEEWEKLGKTLTEEQITAFFNSQEIMDWVSADESIKDVEGIA